MANKSNIRSIRFSDDLAELIDRQAGGNFSEKFTNLITRCVWELPNKQHELSELDARILKKKYELQELCNLYYRESQRLRKICDKISQLGEVCNTK